jgi:hypothetical protein
MPTPVRRRTVPDRKFRTIRHAGKPVPGVHVGVAGWQRACCARATRARRRQSATAIRRRGAGGTVIEVRNADPSHRAAGDDRQKGGIMRKKRWLVAFVLADFSALNVYVLSHYGFTGFYEMVTANAATVLALVDLTIALSLIVAWMWNDARDRGLSPLPYVVLTLLFGSIGPLVYLLRSEAEGNAPELRTSAAAS